MPAKPVNRQKLKEMCGRAFGERCGTEAFAQTVEQKLNELSVRLGQVHLLRYAEVSGKKVLQVYLKSIEGSAETRRKIFLAEDLGVVLDESGQVHEQATFRQSPLQHGGANLARFQMGDFKN